MAYRIADLDAEAEYVLTRAEWDAARRRFFRLGAGRDDSLYPPPVPPGTAWARRVTDLAPGPAGYNLSWLVYGDPSSDAASPPGASPDGAPLLPRPEGDLVAGASFDGRLRALWVGRWVAGGAPAATSALPIAHDWWYPSAWGRELSVLLLPLTAVSGPFAAGPSDWLAFGGNLDTDAVLVRSPHPYIPAAAIERQRAGPDVSWGGALRTPVRSRGVSWVRGPGHSARQTESGWTGQLYRQAPEGEIAGAWGAVVDAAEGIVDSATGAARNLGRAATGDLDALQALAAAALVIAVTGGVGAGLAGQLLQGTSVAGSDDPWRAASRVGAIHYAFFISPLSQAWRSGAAVDPAAGSTSAAQGMGASPVRAGMTQMDLETYQVGGLTVSADDVAAAEVWAQRVAVVAPEEANRVLQELARRGAFVDLVLARLVIEAEADDERRARLKAEIAAKQARWWEDYGQYIALALSTIASALGAAPVAMAGFALLEALYQAGIVAANLEVALDQQRRAELEAEREARLVEAEIARLEAELAAGGAPQAGVDVPVGGADRFRSWYAFLVDRWLGVKS